VIREIPSYLGIYFRKSGSGRESVFNKWPDASPNMLMLISQLMESLEIWNTVSQWCHVDLCVLVLIV
jgi:hypothetical protein